MTMRRRRRSCSGHGEHAVASTTALLCYFCCCVLLLAAGATAQTPTSYKTLTGEAPIVIAEGGFSGIFPDSSSNAFNFALSATSSETSLWCDVQLTNDGVGICLRDLLMNNCTNIDQVDPAGKRQYRINGVRKTGWFSVDYNMSSLKNVILTQAIWSRPDYFDFAFFPILPVTGVISLIKPSSLWLNVEHDIFYREHGLNMTEYILSIHKYVSVKYISSPELGFLQSISGRVNSKTKLVFRFLDKVLSDPSTNKTYGSLSSNLTFIKTIASGIMVPKDYIWPVTDDNYIQLPTRIVADAHSADLEIYASDFANDRIIPYNYSYDPLGEYLSFVSDGGFSVDGVLTDHPLTASEAIGCFTNLNTSRATDHGKPLIISHNGASGDYPDCTDLAYENAVKDGADVIDCSIQMTSDGIPICMSSINLLDSTDVQKSTFSSLVSVIPEIQATPGIFTFNLTWDNINTLKPKISSPDSAYYIVRNPRYSNKGKFFNLSDFLKYAKDKDLSGIMITIENAAFMAKSLGIDVVDSITTALGDAGYNNQTTKDMDVMIQSTDSAVLVKLKQQKSKFKLVYTLPSSIGDASASSLLDIKKFAGAVVVHRQSVFPDSANLIIKQTNLVKDLQSAGLAVYAEVFRNEFVSQLTDFFADATVEINNYVQLVDIDGFITDFPKTVRRYKMNSCTALGDDMPNYMEPVEIGGLAQLLKGTTHQPPPLPPMPALNASDVNEQPLPPVAQKNASAGDVPVPGATPSAGDAPASIAPPGASPSAADAASVSTGILLVTVCASLLI